MNRSRLKPPPKNICQKGFSRNNGKPGGIAGPEKTEIRGLTLQNYARQKTPPWGGFERTPPEPTQQKINAKNGPVRQARKKSLGAQEEKISPGSRRGKPTATLRK